MLRRRLIVGLSGLGAVCCGDEGSFAIREDEVCFQRRDGEPVCIETYEASRTDSTADDPGTALGPPRSRAGQQPWTRVTWFEASEACASKAKRLCTRDEWLDACDGGIGEDLGSRFPYGNDLDLSVCHVEGAAPEPTGAASSCRSPLETFDQGGNVWEWTGLSAASAAARGGGFSSGAMHDCTAGDRSSRFGLESRDLALGFRCCRDE